ncbi:MAG: flagellar basal body-associated FliL family protein [Alphaproteobacteria bacterium]|nr:flagellar basal body-associated FliL family protein [Alphaproteobacteria bacterium]
MASDSFDNDGGRSFYLKRKLSGRKILFFIIGIAALIGIVYAIMSYTVLGDFVKSRISGQEASQASLSDAPPNVKTKSDKPTTTTFMDLPDMLVNLRSDDPRPSFLKLSVSLELDSNEDKLVVLRVLPRVIDTFQVYLRELRAEQMQGAAGLLRLREELLGRINAAVSPVQVRDVLFREMLVQ